MITHKNLHLFVFQAMVEHIKTECPSTSIGSLPVDIKAGNPFREMKKPAITIFDSRIQNSEEVIGLGNLAMFPPYGETAESIFEYNDGRTIEIDMSIMINANSHTENMDLTGSIREIVFNIVSTPLLVKDYSTQTPVYPILPEITPEIKIINRKDIDVRIDYEKKDKSHYSIVRFPIEVSFATPTEVFYITDIDTDTNLQLP